MEEARGQKITVRFEARRCIHSRHCVTGEPGVFRAGVKGEWIFPDAADVERVVRVAHACPSGAIAYDRRDGGPQEAPPPVNILHIRENGPLAVRADLRMGGEAIGFRATLCRCGASRNKPFCDGAHNEIGFVATGEPPTKSNEALAVRDGPLTLAPQVNGPMMMEGNLEICSGTGRVVAKTKKVFLCRCGQSKNKPFCDGSHKTAGFIAP